MKKQAFTLAEILITLGIIGVVAALTAPALVQNVGTAKTGPTLAKVSSTLENAHEQLLHEEEASDLYKITGGDIVTYYEKLSKYINGSSYETDPLEANDFSSNIKKYSGENMVFNWNAFRAFNFSDNISLFMHVYDDTSYDPKGSFKGRLAVAYVDINGFKSAPNTLGKDIFGFYIDRSGQLIPMGSNTSAWLYNDDARKYTATEGTYGCNENYVGNGLGCTGSILENNLKVIYQ